MPTAVLDLDLEKIPSDIVGLDRFDRALVLGRFDGHPIAQLYMPVMDGKIAGEAVRDRLLAAAGDRFPMLWLQRFLHIEDKSPEIFRATVAICTRERPEDLKRCLNSVVGLIQQGHEVLVVDNCPSTDATRRVVQQFAGIRYVCEMRPGLNNARNGAVAHSTRPIVAFIDDDAVADPFWLQNLIKNFDDPMVACVTGLTMPLELETEAQEWFEQHCPFGKGFERRIFRGDSHNPLHSGQIGAGVNMAIRRDVLLSVGAFDPSLDAGTPTQSGGDHEMFSRVLANGYSIVYEPDALNWHRHRRTWPELQKVLYGYGVGVYALLTRTLLIEKEPAALKVAWGWFRYDQFPALLRAMRGKIDEKRLNLLGSELRGCLAGPFAYFRSQKLHAGIQKV